MIRGRRRRGRRGRLPLPIKVGQQPVAEAFIPQPDEGGPPIVIEIDELEAVRLADLEGLSQEEAGAKMGVSRGTIWRLLQRGRKKIAQALIEGRRIQIRRHVT